MKIQIEIKKEDLIRYLQFLYIEEESKELILSIFDNTNILNISDQAIYKTSRENNTTPSITHAFAVAQILLNNKEQFFKKKYNNIFTACYSEEEANEVGHFIMSKGYEGVQNDSYRYCDIMIDAAFGKNRKHDINHIYVGVAGCQMIVAKTKRGLRRKGLIFIEKKRKFFELLDRY